MTNNLVKLFSNIAEAIRLKTGNNEKIKAQDFPQKIKEIGNDSDVSVSLNIAYGETPPEDTSKLWIKANKPNNIKIGSGNLSQSYIESTGTQYIDTGYIANQDTRIECKYQIVGYKGDYDNLFGDITNVMYSHIYNNEGNRGYQFARWGGKDISWGNVLVSSDITTLDLANGKFTFTENGVVTTKTVNANAEFASQYSLLLFCNRYYRNVSIYDSTTCCKARLYYFKIYEGEELVRDFIPAMDNNGAICLYDNVTKAYFYNQGTGEFVGNIIHSELTQGNIEIRSDSLINKFNLINTENTQVEIGVDSVLIGNENNEAEPVEAHLYKNESWVQI